jgi:hypothetical protein
MYTHTSQQTPVNQVDWVLNHLDSYLDIFERRYSLNFSNPDWRSKDDPKAHKLSCLIKQMLDIEAQAGQAESQQVA